MDDSSWKLIRIAANVIGGVVSLLLLVLTGARAHVQSPHPSDQFLIDNLRLHGAYYRALVAEKTKGRGVVGRRSVLIEESDKEWGEGLVTRTKKGYVYSTEELRPLVNSLDGFKEGDDVSAYRKLEGNWYLYHYASVDKPR